MSRTVVAVYPDRQAAERAVEAVVDLGEDVGHISVLSHRELDETPDVRVAAGAGVAGGAAVGALATLGLAAIPGVGWALAAGPLGSVLVGGTVGAAAGAVGGVATTIADRGVPGPDARMYTEAVRRGGPLVLVETDDARADAVARVLAANGPIDVDRTLAPEEDAPAARADRPTADAGEREAERLRRERTTYAQDDAATLRSGPSRVRTYAGPV